ncbi:hypothetical protein BD779DRAFT_1677863 [Infundibulicybe gibba]|nr:hypothetical protein BD779DRAFT_1677863 [Infundibulicybe gibba]
MKSKSISSTKSSSKKKAQAPAPIPILLDDDETGESELECGGRNSPPLPATAEPAQSDSEPELVGAVFNSISLPSSTVMRSPTALDSASSNLSHQSSIASLTPTSSVVDTELDPISQLAKTI